MVGQKKWRIDIKWIVILAIVEGWMHSVLKDAEKAPYDAKATAEILKSSMPINWEKTGN